MNYILFDNPQQWKNLLPLTFTRPTSCLRTGILTIAEKWNNFLGSECSYKTIDYLSLKYPEKLDEKNTYINGAIIPDEKIIEAIHSLKPGEALFKDDIPIAKLIQGRSGFALENIHRNNIIKYSGEINLVEYPWDLFLKNGDEIAADIKLISKGKKSKKLSNTNNIIGKENIFVEEGVKADFVTINAKPGSVYLGKDAEIMEGAVIRGPFALCEQSVLKLSAKVYGPVTIGPFSKVGGEITESVILGYSNKAHDGFLGNSVIGEWCNLGADTNNSNLKNNYAEVKVWNYNQERFINSGLQFCGLIMGDHSKCGINTMFNTGTVVGVSANIFGSGFPRNIIPSFSWGGAQGFMVYKPEKAFEVAHKVMARRKKEFDKTEKEILLSIFQSTEKYRRY